MSIQSLEESKTLLMISLISATTHFYSQNKYFSSNFILEKSVLPCVVIFQSIVWIILCIKRLLVRKVYWYIPWNLYFILILWFHRIWLWHKCCEQHSCSSRCDTACLHPTRISNSILGGAFEMLGFGAKWKVRGTKLLMSIHYTLKDHVFQITYVLSST